MVSSVSLFTNNTFTNKSGLYRVNDGPSTRPPTLLNRISHLYCQSYQFFGQTAPAAQGLDCFWDECKCAGNLRILKFKKMYNDNNVLCRPHVNLPSSTFIKWGVVEPCTYRMVGAELEGVRRKHSDRKEPQEHEAANSWVLNMWVSCRDKEQI